MFSVSLGFLNMHDLTIQIPQKKLNTEKSK